MTCDTISGHFVADIGENADIGGGNNPDGEERTVEKARGEGGGGVAEQEAGEEAGPQGDRAGIRS